MRRGRLEVFLTSAVASQSILQQAARLQLLIKPVRALFGHLISNQTNSESLNFSPECLSNAGLLRIIYKVTVSGNNDKY